MKGKIRPYYEKVLQSECQVTSIKCKGCQKEFLSTSILKHLGHKKSCKDSFSQEEFNSMNEKAKLRKWAKMKSWLDKHKDDQSKQNAMRYRKLKESMKSAREELSEYEKIRLANIEKNQALLKELKSKNKM